MSSKDSGLAQARVQSFLGNTTQQGTTFVPGQGGNQGRADRVETATRAVDQQFTNPAAAQQQGQGSHHGGRNADLAALLEALSADPITESPESL